jgi:hypothetical protein
MDPVSDCPLPFPLQQLFPQADQRAAALADVPEAPLRAN